MENQSLITIIEKFIDILDTVEIKPEDKAELLINIRNFLDPNDYRRNITILAQDKYERRFERYVKENEQHSDIGESKPSKKK